MSTRENVILQRPGRGLFVPVEGRRAGPRRGEAAQDCDGLTGLPDRRALLRRLEQALRATPRGCGLTLLYLDLDRFREINAALGYGWGDSILKEMAARLEDCTCEGDLLARLGNDEFAIARRCADPAEAGAALARQVLSALGEPVMKGGTALRLGAHVGIAAFPTHGAAADRLLRCAELAFYKAKAERSSRYAFFRIGMDARPMDRHALEAELQEAVRSRGFELYYQPVLDLRRNEIACCEALIRWRHPQRGIILPSSFIPLAEATGLIVPMGEWALRVACGEAAGWPSHLKVAVNLSAAQFDPSLTGAVARALEHSGLAPDRLELEITESVLLRRTDETLTILRDLRSLGVRIAMDDFGAGYSSLLYLRSFPFDKIKIDRSFVADLSPDDARSVAILRAAVALGTSLGMTTTAEGVETVQQLDIVRAEGCTEMQGYLLSPPRPVGEIRALLDISPGPMPGAPLTAPGRRERSCRARVA